MLCYVMLCYVMLCYVMLCYVVTFYIMLHFLILSDTSVSIFMIYYYIIGCVKCPVPVSRDGNISSPEVWILRVPDPLTS